MFEQTFLETGASVRRPWPVAFSFAVQLLLAGAILLLPLLHTARLMWKPSTITIYIPSRVPPPVVQASAAPRSAASIAPAAATRPVFQAPRAIPLTISTQPSLEPAPEFGAVALSNGAPNAIPFGPPAITAANRPTASPSPGAKPEPSRIRVGTGVQAAKLIAQPRPAYPALAKAARVSGTVRLQAIIGRDGSIQNLQLLSGPPLLVPAALDAVSQWRYQPTLLNGQPVEVVTEIQVNFTLNQ